MTAPLSLQGGRDKQGHSRGHIFTVIESYSDQNYDRKLSQWAKNQFLRDKQGSGTFSLYVVTPKMAKIWCNFDPGCPCLSRSPLYV